MWQRGEALIAGVTRALSLTSPPAPAPLLPPEPTLAAFVRSSRELRPLLDAACNLCASCLGELLRYIVEDVGFQAGLCGDVPTREPLFGQQPRFFCSQAVAYDVTGRIAAGHPMQHSPEAIHGSKMYNLPCIVLAGLGRLQELKSAIADGWGCHELACDAAARHGHTAVLQWLHDDAHMEVGETVTLLAAEGGWLETLQWALASGCPASPRLAVAAVRHRHTHVLRWLVDGLRRPWVEDTDALCCQAAASVGDLPTLQYLRRSGCPWNAATCTAAAASGHLTVLQWARSTGAKWDVATCTAAAEAGHLRVLRWLREPCPWDEETTAALVRRGHLASAHWARDLGCPPGSLSEVAGSRAPASPASEEVAGSVERPVVVTAGAGTAEIGAIGGTQAAVDRRLASRVS
jgi:hypothetical protein